MTKSITLALVAIGALIAIPHVASAQFDATDWAVSNRIGVGVDNPTNTIHLAGGGITTTFKIESTNGGTPWFFRSTDGTHGDRFDITPMGSPVVMAIKATGNIGIGTTLPTTKLDVRGEVKVEVLQITGGADLAERFNVRSPQAAKPNPGDIVCIDPANAGDLVVSAKPYDRTVAGIISGAGGLDSGLMMGQIGSKASGAHAVALTGRVYCKVDASYGAIRPGDLLTTSASPAHAMKVTDYTRAQGAILGKAMTSLDSGKGLVLVLVSLQ